MEQAIRRALEDYADPRYHRFENHSTASELRGYLGSECPEALGYRWFAVVRNPFDLTVSLWRFIAESKHHRDHQIVASLSLPEFVEWLSNEGWQRWNPEMNWRIDQAPPFARYMTMAEFICDQAGNPLVDSILRTEDLADDFAVLCEQVGVEIALPHKNATTHADYHQYYTPESIAKVSSHHAKDLELFGYRY